MIEAEHLDESYAGKRVRLGFADGEMAEVRIPLDRIAQTNTTARQRDGELFTTRFPSIARVPRRMARPTGQG
jgi:hypothetical protein